MPGRSYRYAVCLVVLLASLMALSVHATSSHAAGSGGARMPGLPQVRTIRCVPTASAPCPVAGAVAPGGTLRLFGADLDTTERIVFRGGRGADDDVSVRPRHQRGGHLEASVPTKAKSGSLALVSSLGAETSAPDPVAIRHLPPRDMAPGRSFFLAGRRQPSVTVNPAGAQTTVELVREADGEIVRTWNLPPSSVATTVRWDGMLESTPAPTGSYRLRASTETSALRQAPKGTDGSFAFYDHVFPIRGKHDLGQSGTNNFGGGRGHQGQDMFARCGVPLAAAQGGTVKRAGTDGRSGNYVVITGRGGDDYVYMHLDATPLVVTGQRVFTGQAIGAVGASGNASGCHLHFELWRSPGWYTGGSPINALSLLRTWDDFS